MNDVSIAEEARCAISPQAKHTVLRVSQWVLLLVAELWAPRIGHEVEEEARDPCAETTADGDGPVLTRETLLADLQRVTSDLNNDCLTTEDADPDDNKERISEDTLENIKLVVDLARVNEIENLHDGENVKHICHVSTHTVLLFHVFPHWSAVPIIDSTRVDEFI